MAIRNVTATTCSDLTTVEIIIDDAGINYTKVYQLADGRCVTLTSGTTSTYPVNSYFPYGPFNNCTLCGAAISGNTWGNNNICLSLCTGDTVSVTPPHPVWTNAQNKSVIQFNAVTLGGNGLNS